MLLRASRHASLSTSYGPLSQGVLHSDHSTQQSSLGSNHTLRPRAKHTSFCTVSSDVLRMVKQKPAASHHLVSHSVVVAKNAMNDAVSLMC